MKSDRLFKAMGEIDPALVQRSNQRQQRGHSRRLFAALAACLVLVAGVGGTLYRQHSAKPAQSLPDRAASDTLPPAPADSALQLNGARVGALHLCQLREDASSAASPAVPDTAPDTTALPAFVINVNRELYATAAEADTYIIRPKAAPAQAKVPPICFTIQHQPTASPAEAMQTAADSLATEFADVSTATETPAGRLYLTAGNGTAWNAAQTELWAVPDTKGGCFLLTARYFTEAEEGHSIRFRDMAETFQVVPSGTSVPEWMQRLCHTADRLMAAIFSNRLEEIADLVDLGDSGFLSGYGEDVSADISIAAIDYTIDDTSEEQPMDTEQNPSAAIVSVKHRLGLEDSFNYLTMELRCQDGQWVLCSAGIEK